MESQRPNRRTKHYRTAEMPSPWDQPQVAPSATPNIWVITGPSGAGKSRVGKYLCSKLGFIFVEGDEFLTEEEKANSGVLNGERHAEVLAATIHEAIRQARHSTTDVVVACSALRVTDRKAWRAGISLANTGAIPKHGFQPPYAPVFENFSNPSVQEDLGLLDKQDPYLQRAQNPYNQGDPYSQPTAPSVLNVPAPAIRPIHLHFVYLIISEDVSRRAVGNRRRRSNHFVHEVAVPEQFKALQPPEAWEHDCFNQISLERSELTVAVEKHVVKMSGRRRNCMCMFCTHSPSM